ncbi:hypothetical protein IGI37_003064 [Enterococcus sp. AZ194]|uniref:LPXTG cell wall anchor domain-containing protein n=1 Tax=Enterococcus sp. AZ194 TaxID=2774629 RepID=UPI003F225ABD
MKKNYRRIFLLLLISLFLVRGSPIYAEEGNYGESRASITFYGSLPPSPDHQIPDGSKPVTNPPKTKDRQSPKRLPKTGERPSYYPIIYGSLLLLKGGYWLIGKRKEAIE